LIDITGELHEAYKLGTKQQGVGSVWFGEVYEDYMPEGYWDQDNDNDANITLRFGGLEYWRNAEFRENIERDRHEEDLQLAVEDPALFVLTKVATNINEFFRDWEAHGSRKTALYTCDSCGAAGCSRDEGKWVVGGRGTVWRCNDSVSNCIEVQGRLESSNEMIRRAVG